jgi:Concanavalin A-like lectin/glucanases superfamily
MGWLSGDLTLGPSGLLAAGSSDMISLNKWVHVAVVFSIHVDPPPGQGAAAPAGSCDLDIYVNGSLQVHPPYYHYALCPAADLAWGYVDPALPMADTDVDELALWTVQLTPTQIAAVAAATKPVGAP